MSIPEENPTLLLPQFKMDLSSVTSSDADDSVPVEAVMLTRNDDTDVESVVDEVLVALGGVVVRGAVMR